MPPIYFELPQKSIIVYRQLQNNTIINYNIANTFATYSINRCAYVIYKAIHYRTNKP